MTPKKTKNLLYDNRSNGTNLSQNDSLNKD